MAKFKGDEEEKDLEEKTFESLQPSITFNTFCDFKGIGKVDRQALSKTYKGVLHTQEEWLSLLENQIIIK